MKAQDKQIVSMLSAFNPGEVFKALDLYTQGIENDFRKAKDELLKDGWSPRNEKPLDREFYLLGGKYWVQSDEARARDIKKIIGDKPERLAEPSKPRKYTGQKMDLESSGVNCPRCGAKTYKQPVCPGCKDGKAGYKIRLICEENPDHEVLL